MAYTELEKQMAAEELILARQHIKDLGSRAETRDYDRLEKAKKHFTKVTGRKA